MLHAFVVKKVDKRLGGKNKEQQRKKWGWMNGDTGRAVYTVIFGNRNDVPFFLLWMLYRQRERVILYRKQVGKRIIFFGAMQC